MDLVSLETYQYVAVQTRGAGRCESQVELRESNGLIEILVWSRTVDLGTGLSSVCCMGLGATRSRIGSLPPRRTFLFILLDLLICVMAS